MQFSIIFIILFLNAVFGGYSSSRQRYARNDEDDKLNTLLESTKLIMDYLNESRWEFNESFEWTSVLRRQDGSVDFCRNWNDYRNGFGNPPNGEFFIGLEKLHQITTSTPHELLIVLKDWDDEMRHAYYNLFQIDSETGKYALKTLGNYIGDAGDAFTYHLGAKFSTMDRDNDESKVACAQKWKGGWWFKDCYSCHLNGPYRQERDAKHKGIGWYTWNGNDYSYKFAEMKIRPKSLFVLSP